MSATPRGSVRTRTRRVALIAAGAIAALALSACGSSSASDQSAGHSTGHSAARSSGQATTGAHNAQDVAFAQGMIPHHQQAIEMAGLAADRASSAQVKDLAARIEKAQGPEITTMTGWLKSWGEEVPASGHSMSAMPGMTHGSMPGMMNTDDMDKLRGMSGKSFDTMFLTMMVEHHEGAVTMATAEKDKGRYGAATAMADDIITTQKAEIAEMNKMLGKS
ncbi:DUF305 domain-containing protein [Streptomyces sp. H51]|uniref:DUF305 domain-containing protein n=1 Tax=Streptomyces sp. H51 TaxID=3111770 RepID=UPI002D77FBF4|nr:DUF305 domain-containing protein [Streptomyces sp. H51]